MFNASKKDTLSFKGTIELPAGLNLLQPQTLSVAVGNVVDTANLTTNGHAKTGTNGLLKNVFVKYPRLKKPATTTSAGMKATVSFTMTVPDLSAQGFDCGRNLPGWRDGRAVRPANRSGGAALRRNGLPRGYSGELHTLQERQQRLD